MLIDSGISVFAIAAILVCGVLWSLRARKNRLVWAAFTKPFKPAEYPLKTADTSKESGGWLLDNHRSRVRKAWVTANDGGVFVWHFWKRRRYQAFTIDWAELSSIVFQRFKRPNSWGSDDWGHAELSFRDGRENITIPWRQIFNEPMPETIGFKIHPKYYEQDV